MRSLLESPQMDKAELSELRIRDGFMGHEEGPWSGPLESGY